MTYSKKEQEFLNFINQTIRITCAKYVKYVGSNNFYTEASADELNAFLELDIEEIQTY